MESTFRNVNIKIIKIGFSAQTKTIEITLEKPPTLHNYSLNQLNLLRNIIHSLTNNEPKSQFSNIKVQEIIRKYYISFLENKIRLDFTLLYFTLYQQ